MNFVLDQVDPKPFLLVLNSKDDVKLEKPEGGFFTHPN